MATTSPSEPSEPSNGLAGTPPHRDGQTTPVKDSVRAPQQPHERDESSSSQQGAPSDVMQKAHDDVTEGRADTSRAEATDRTYGTICATAAKAKSRRQASRPRAASPGTIYHRERATEAPPTLEP